MRSDWEGCDQLEAPCPLVPLTPLKNAGVPILSLMDALSDEHVDVTHKVTHSIRSGKIFDN